MHSYLLLLLQNWIWRRNRKRKVAEELQDFPLLRFSEYPVWSQPTFKIIRLSSKYVQILHVNGNHWVDVTNMDLYSNKGYTDRVLIFDSLVPRRVGMNLKKQVCSFVRPMEPTVSFDIANIMPQTNQYDCGLFAIANATASCKVCVGHG